MHCCCSSPAAPLTERGILTSAKTFAWNSEIVTAFNTWISQNWPLLLSIGQLAVLGSLDIVCPIWLDFIDSMNCFFFLSWIVTDSDLKGRCVLVFIIMALPQRAKDSFRVIYKQLQWDKWRRESFRRLWSTHARSPIPPQFCTLFSLLLTCSVRILKELIIQRVDREASLHSSRAPRSIARLEKLSQCCASLSQEQCLVYRRDFFSVFFFLDDFSQICDCAICARAIGSAHTSVCVYTSWIAHLRNIVNIYIILLWRVEMLLTFLINK